MRAAAPALALALAACSLPANKATPTGPVNACERTSECAGGAVCAAGRCVAAEVDLAGLLLEVRPRPNAAYGAGTSFFFTPEQAGLGLVASGAQAFVARLDPKLPAFVAIREAIVQLDEKTPLEQGCGIGPDRAVPATVTFFRVAPYAGLSFEKVTTTTHGENRLDVDLVPGVYDVYVEPQKVDGCNGGQPFPPAILSRTSILTGAAQVWKLPPVGKLGGTVTGFGQAPVEGWTVELLEPDRGLVVSASGALLPGVTGDARELVADFTWPETGTPILRLTPPPAAHLPTVYYDAGTAVGGKTNLVFTQSLGELLVPAVTASATVVDPEDVWPVPAAVAVQSVRLADVNNGQNAAFADASVPTDPQTAIFSLPLPAGEYTLRLTPNDNGLAITDVGFGPFGAGIGCFCGHRVELARKLSLGAALELPDESGVGGVTVTFEASAEPPRTAWARTHALPPLVPRTIAEQTASDGAFSLLVDPGIGDVVVRTDPGSGYPWLVLPRVDPRQTAALGLLQLRYPALVRGVVTDPSGAPIANATIDAWYPVRDPEAESGLTGTVVRIGMATTDASGAYTLLLPPSL